MHLVRDTYFGKTIEHLMTMMYFFQPILAVTRDYSRGRYIYVDMQLLFWMLFRSVIYCIFLELSCHQMQKHVLYLVQMCVPWHLCNCSSHEHYRIMYTSISDEMVTLNLGFRNVLRYYHAELDYLKEKFFFTFFVKFLQHMFWFLTGTE